MYWFEGRRERRRRWMEERKREGVDEGREKGKVEGFSSLGTN